MNNKHIEKQAKELIESHLKAITNMESLEELYPLIDLIEIAQDAAIISANLVREQFLLAPQIEYWNKIIQAIKDYKYES